MCYNDIDLLKIGRGLRLLYNKLTRFRAKQINLYRGLKRLIPLVGLSVALDQMHCHLQYLYKACIH